MRVRNVLSIIALVATDGADVVKAQDLAPLTVDGDWEDWGGLAGRIRPVTRCHTRHQQRRRCPQI